MQALTQAEMNEVSGGMEPGGCGSDDYVAVALFAGNHGI